MKICPNCGSQLNDEARFCTECGQSFDVAAAANSFEAPVQQAPVQQVPVQQAPVQQAPVQQAPVQQAPVQNYSQPVSGGMPAYAPAPQPKKSNKKTIAIIAVAAVLVIAIAACLFIFKDSIFGSKDSDSTKKSKEQTTEQVDTQSTSEKALDAAMNAVFDFDGKALSKITAPEMKKLIESEIKNNDLGEDVKTVEDFFNYQLDGVRDGFEGNCGKIKKMSYSIDDTEEAAKEDIDDFKENLEDEGITAGNITEAINYSVRVDVEGEEDTDYDYYDVILIKEDGKWYFFNLG